MIVTDRSKLEVISRPTSIAECKELGLFELLEAELKASVVPGVGLAAIQVGHALRASLMITDKKAYRMINPVLFNQEGPILFTGEACLSQPGKSYNTDRFNQVTVRWLDYDEGVEKVAETNGFNAVVLQHEIDHMDGILNYKREHIQPIKIGRNEPCPDCIRNGITIKWKKCKIHNKEAQ